MLGRPQPSAVSFDNRASVWLVVMSTSRVPLVTASIAWTALRMRLRVTTILSKRARIDRGRPGPSSVLTFRLSPPRQLTRLEHQSCVLLNCWTDWPSPEPVSDGQTVGFEQLGSCGTGIASLGTRFSLIRQAALAQSALRLLRKTARHGNFSDLGYGTIDRGLRLTG